MDYSSKIFVAGHSGLAGQSLVKKLKELNYHNLLLPSSRELDLTQQTKTHEFLITHKPDVVILAAARVGGIKANMTYPADFFYQNISIQTNVIHGCYLTGVPKLLFLGSSCMYPRECPQPMKEEYLFTGPFEKTNEAYALAKAAGVKQCEFYNHQFNTRYLCLIPTNLYGPSDNFHLDHAHVIPALIHKMHLAKTQNRPHLEIWGSGQTRREFLFVDDLSEAILHVLTSDITETPLNVGTGRDVTIRELAETIQEVTRYTGTLVFDSRRPEGPPQKLLDVSKLTGLQWRARHSLQKGIEATYHWFVNNFDNVRK